MPDSVDARWDDKAPERVPTQAELNAIETFTAAESRLKDAATRLHDLAVYRDATDGCWYVVSSGGPNHKLITAWNEFFDGEGADRV